MMHLKPHPLLSLLLLLPLLVGRVNIVSNGGSATPTIAAIAAVSLVVGHVDVTSLEVVVVMWQPVWCWGSSSPFLIVVAIHWYV